MMNHPYQSQSLRTTDLDRLTRVQEPAAPAAGPFPRSFDLRSFCLTCLLLFLSAVSFAQSRTVTGKVTAQDDGGSLPGVNVLVKGTTTGATTDAGGNYTLSVPGNDAVIVFSFIGYKTQEVAVGNRTTINMDLAADLQALEEVVVTGYTTENRREVTGAVSTVKAKDLVAVPSGNVEQQFQGRVAGVTVITNGQPGTTSIVRVRGFGALGGNEPLYIVDGVPVESTNFLQPDDIAETTVLKDATTASIYGARAANGVIVITTKKGKRDGKMHVTYDGVFGVTTPGRVDNILNPQETADWTWQAIRNTAFQQGVDPVFNHPQYGTDPNGPVLPDYLLVGGQSGVVGQIDLDAERVKYNNDATKGPVYLVMPANKEGTNWWNAITRVAPLNRHVFSFSGGTERNNYYVSFGIQDQAGIVIHQDFKRYSFRVNSEHSVLKNLRIGENIQGTYLRARGIFGGNGGRGSAQEENDILQAFRMPSIIPVYDAFGGYGGTQAKGFNNPRNPVANRNRGANNQGYAIQGFGNIYAEMDVLKGLTLRSSVGGGVSNGYFYNYGPPQYENSENNTSFNYGEGASSFFNWVFTNTARYQHKFGLHGVDILGGIESLNTPFGRNVNGNGLNPAFTDPNFINLSNTQASGRTVNSFYQRGSRFYSLFSQVRYNFNDKYIITGVMRRDGSSQFGSNNRYGIFPAVSAAWRITSEPFMQGLTFIDDLKIRGGWGEMGNSRNVDQNNQFNLFAASLGGSSYDITGSNSGVIGGFFRSRIGNPNAKWETSVTSNIGLDGTFLKGKLDLVFDIWRKDTRDLLYTLETPAVVGPVANDPAINIAKMRNQGIDIQVVTRGNVTMDLGYEVTVNGAFLDNKIAALAPSVNYFDAGGTRIGNVIRNQVGLPISSFFGYKTLGLFQTQEEVDAAPEQPGKGVGRFRFEDVTGDGKIDAEDRTYLGNPVPKFNGGINLKLNFRNFELETFLYTALGFQNYNFSKWFTDFYPSFTGAAIGTNVKDSWLPGKGGNTTPIFENVSNFSTNNQSNSYYVENGSYARMTNLQIAYNLPAALLGRTGFERARIYVQGSNLLTFSKYSGLDPGVGGNADTTLGIDVGNPPVTRGFNVGLNLGF